MGKNNLYPFLLQHSNPLNRLLCEFTIRMNAADVPFRVTPFPDLLLFAHDPSIVTSIPGQVDKFIRSCPCQKVDVSRQMARSVGNVEATIAKEVDHAW